MECYLWDDLERAEDPSRAPRGRGGTVLGEAIEVKRNFYPAGFSPGRHSHAHEQIVTVLEGKVRVSVGDEVAEAGPGSVVRFPPNVPHNVEVIEDALFISCKNLVEGQGSAGPRTWYEPPYGGRRES